MVKIKDFSDIDPNEPLHWNVVEDLIVYMRNEPNFYRRHMYPTMLDVQETVRKGGKFDKKKMLPMVDEALKSYLERYEINKRPEDVMSKAEKMECIDLILKTEASNFRKGAY